MNEGRKGALRIRFRARSQPLSFRSVGVNSSVTHCLLQILVNPDAGEDRVLTVAQHEFTVKTFQPRPVCMILWGLLRCAPRAEVGCRIDDAECGGGRSVPSACLERNGGTAERRPDESGQATEGADHDGRCQPLGPRTARPRCWRDRRATPRRALLTRRRWRRTVLESGWPALRRAARTASASGGGGASALSTSSERGWSPPPERRSRRGSGAGAERCSTVS